MLKRWYSPALGLLLLLAAVPAAAQSPGTFELGTFGRYTAFDSFRDFDPALGLSGRVGLFVLPRVSLEVDASRANADGPAGEFKYTPLHARVLYNHPMGARSDLLLGLGYSHNDFGEDDRSPNPEYGFGALAGMRFGFGERLAFRIDGTLDVMPARMNSNYGVAVRQPDGSAIASFDDTRYWGLQTGISLLVDPLRPRQQPTGPIPVAPAPAPAEAEPEPEPVAEEAPPAPPAPPEPEVDAAAEAARARAVVIERIHFAYDRSEIGAEAAAILVRKVTVLRENPDLIVRIEGHADERGSTEYNLALGLRRANATRDYLVGQGIDAARLETISLGESRPLDPAPGEAAWAQNRRAEFRIIAGGEMLKLPASLR